MSESLNVIRAKLVGALSQLPYLPRALKLVWAALVAATMLLAEALRSVAGWVRAAQAELVRDHVSDRIHVMVDGQIIESGRHAELRGRGGLYARSWAAQMEAGGVLAEQF